MTVLKNKAVVIEEATYNKCFVDAVEEMVDKINSLGEENYLLKNTIRNTLLFLNIQHS